MKRHNFKSGDVIFREGERSNAAYLITSGQVEIVLVRDHDKSKTIAVLNKGEYFGEMGAIDDKPRSASAIAKGPLVCMSVGQKEFTDMLINRPQESINLL